MKFIVRRMNSMEWNHESSEDRVEVCGMCVLHKKIKEQQATASRRLTTSTRYCLHVSREQKRDIQCTLNMRQL